APGDFATPVEASAPPGTSITPTLRVYGRRHPVQASGVGWKGRVHARSGGRPGYAPGNGIPARGDATGSVGCTAPRAAARLRARAARAGGFAADGAAVLAQRRAARDEGGAGGIHGRNRRHRRIAAAAAGLL